VLAAGALAAGTAEGLARHAIDGRIAAAARAKLSGPVSVGIGFTPALIDAATGQIPGVTINAPSAKLCGLPDVDATATLTDVRREHGTVTAQGTSASVVLSPDTLTAGLAAKYPGATVTPDPADQSLVITAEPGGLVQVHERVRLDGRTLELSPASLSVFGRSVPPSQQLTSKLTVHRTLSGLPLGLAPRAASVTAGGIRLDLTAGPAQLSDQRGQCQGSG